MKISKVLALCLSPDKGGLELYIIKLFQHYKGSSHDLHIGCSKNSYISENVDDNKIECTNRGIFKTAINFFILRRYIITNKINILHVSWSKDLLLAVMLKLLMSKNIKIIFYRQMKIPRPKKSFYHKIFYKNIDLFLVITDKLKDEACRYLPIDNDKIKKLVYGISKPSSAIELDTPNFLKSTNLDSEEFSIGIFSRVEEQKGQHLVLEAMNISSNQMNAYVIGHVMSNQYKKRLLEIAKKYKLTQHLKFIKFLDSPMSCMPFFDLVILPTYEETFGLVAAEAMIMGVPVIGSNAGGVPEVISHGSTGLLFETKDARDLSEKIDMIFENKSLRDKFIFNASKFARTEYNYNKHFDRLDELINSI